MKHMARIFAGLCIAMLILSSQSGSDSYLSYGKTSVSDLEEQMEDIKKEIEQAQKDIMARNTELSAVQAEISLADLEFHEFSRKIQDLEGQIVLKEEEINKTLEKLVDTIEEQNAYYAHSKDRIKVMYEHGETAYLEVLLESKDTSDFFNRLEYMNKLIEYDQGILDEMEALKGTIIVYENQLFTEKASLEELIIENTKLLNDVELKLQTKQEKLTQIENDRELLYENIQQWEEEQVKLDEAIQELLLLYSDQELLFGDGRLSWPAPGYKRITSKFGPRIHPVYGYRSNHTGIDVAAPYGANLTAAASGRVIFAGWGNAYGNYVLIDHGRDEQGRHIVTQYAHCSRLLVVEGDVVRRGDVVAKCGSTGWSTGNHLHFGVQIGGTWVDPMTKTDK